MEILLRWFTGGAHRAALRRARAARSAEQLGVEGKGSVSVVRRISAACALPPFRDALAAAASNGHAQSLHLLLTIGGASPDSQNALNQPVLFAAAANGHFCAVEVLLRAGAVPSARNAQRATALHAVASRAHHSTACAQRARAAERAAACARALVAWGADVHAFSGVFVAGGATPLHAASKAGSARVLAVLLESGADANALTKGGRLASLTLAVQRGHCECARALIAGGARLELCDRAGNNALHIAAHRADVATLRIVVQARAQGAARSSSCTMLLGATAEAEAEVLTMSALASQPNASHDTPLHLAAWSGASSCLRLLLSAISGDFDPRSAATGAEAEAGGSKASAAAERCAHLIALPNETGGTALHVACSRGSLACVAALLGAGASPFAPLLQQHLSPSALAVVQRRVACVQALSGKGVFGTTWLDCDTARLGALVRAAAACGSAEILRCILLRRHARRVPRAGAPQFAEKSESESVREGKDDAADNACAPSCEVVEASRRVLQDYRYISSESYSQFGLLPLTSLIVPSREARRSHREVVEAATENGCTALHLAAYGGHAECCEVLLRDAGANPYALNRAGATALHAAVCAQNTSTRVVELLVEFGADADAVTDLGATALYFAVLAADVACVRLLLRCGATARIGTAQCAAALGSRLARSAASERICAALQRDAQYWREQARRTSASAPLDAAQHRRSDALRAATLAADPTRRTLLALLSRNGSGNGQGMGPFVRDAEVRAALGSSAQYTRALALLGKMQVSANLFVFHCVFFSLLISPFLGSQHHGDLLVLERALPQGGRGVEYTLASEETHAAIMRINVQHACATLSIEDEVSVRERLVEHDVRALQQQSQLRARRKAKSHHVPGSATREEGTSAAVESAAVGAAAMACPESGSAAGGRATEQRRRKSAARRGAQPGKKRKTATEVAKAAAERTDDEAFAAAVLIRIVRADLQDAFAGARPGALVTIDTVRMWHDDVALHGEAVRPPAQHEAWEAAWALGRGGIPRSTLPCVGLGTGAAANGGEHKGKAVADDKQGLSPFRCAPPRAEETRAAFLAESARGRLRALLTICTICEKDSRRIRTKGYRYTLCESFSQFDSLPLTCWTKGFDGFECALGCGAPRRAARVTLAATTPRPPRWARALPEIAWLLPREIELFLAREFENCGWKCDVWRQRVRACGAKTLVELRAASDDDLVTRCGWRREWVDAMRSRVTAMFASSTGEFFFIYR